MTARPIALSIDEDVELVIRWDDQSETRYRISELRDQCPCATCREKRKTPPDPFPILSDAETKPLRIEKMRPMGSYAYTIAFSDGHDTGIYTFEYLLELSQSDS